MSLFKRLLFSFLLAILVPALLVGVFSFHRVSQAIEDEVSHSVRQTVQLVNQNIGTHISQAVELSTVVYINPAVQRMMGRQTAATWEQLQDDVQELREDLANVTRYQEMYTVRLFYPDRGQFPSGFEMAELRPLDLLEDTAAYRALLRSPGGMLWTSEPLLPQLMRDEPYVTLLRLVRDKENLTELGVMTVSMPERKLWGIVDDVKFGQAGFVFLMDNDGKVVSHHDKSLLGEDLSGKPYASAILGQTAGDFMAKVDGEEYLFVYQTIEGTPWKLVGFHNARELRNTVTVVRNATIIIALLCFGIAIVYSIYTSGWFARRIGHLIQAMRKLERGQLGTQVVLEGRNRDEISQLYTHFNRMSDELQQQLETIHATSKKMREAELKALQHQINPHFLYNTLDSINWMAATRYKAMDISRMVTSLATLFRLSLNKSHEMTTVSHELQHVDCYVAIQKIRFGNEFELKVQLAPGTERLGMLKLLLQPLVENAILHGFRELDDPGLITIDVSVDGDYLLLDVEDNGVGCDGEAMNERLRQATGAEGQGYGLHNVNERIKLYYGEACGLTFTVPRHGARGTRIQVRLLAGMPEEVNDAS
ncbi:histidine kinase [Paenibacillus sp. 598K]|uniref:sensor histidine kinase n=1 Tax=Paenibacillus sp. 598K TaxID=1117987 RepID=UPI000FF91423|nr:sensor histidine kinase [Paenibacillus sp. 598K]GBF75668.1 histidine kinase [Paenibacillus sp. 598K]